MAPPHIKAFFHVFGQYSSENSPLPPQAQSLVGGLRQKNFKKSEGRM